MRRLTWLLIILAAGLAVRQDVVHLLLHQGCAALRGGDLAAAETAMRRLDWLSAGSPHLAAGLGVLSYRRGDFAQAERYFTRAAEGTNLAPYALYNRGNALFRQAEAASEQQAARALWQGAAADYRRVLAQAPDAADAAANLALALNRLAAVDRESTAQGEAGADEDAAKSGKTAKSGEQPGESSMDMAGQGRARPELTPAEAERLLDEARGRERPSGPLRPSERRSVTADVEKDW